jgi:hypothetical protein
MGGGALLVLAVVQLTLIAAPGVAAALLALRLGVRDEAVLICSGLAGSGVAALLGFWLYFGLPGLGPAYAYLLFFGSLAGIAWLLPRLSAQRELLLRLATPLGLWALGCLFIVFLGFFAGGADHALETGAQRFATEPSLFASDNFIPLFFSEWIFAGSHGAAPVFAPDWLLSDRPPLQIGYVLTQRAFGWDTAMLHYQLIGIAVQQLWIPAAWALLTAARASRRTRALAMVAALVSDVVVVNSFYVWPKLLGAAFVIAALALLVAPGRSPLRARPWTVLLLAALAALAYLSHGSSSFGLIPLAAVALWRGIPNWRWLGAGLAVLLVLVVPWTAYQKYGDPPGDRLIKWSLAGVAEVDDRGVAETMVDSYREAGFDGTVENKAGNFWLMFGGSPAGLLLPPGFPYGDAWQESRDAGSALVHGDVDAAVSKVRELKHWHLLWAFGLLLLALPAIAVGRLRRGWRGSDEWWLARVCLVFFAVGVVAWCLLMFGNLIGRAVPTSTSLALPLIGLVGLVVGLRATIPRLAPWLVGANVLFVLVVYTPYLQLPAGRSYSTFAAIVFLASLAGFVALSFAERRAAPGLAATGQSPLPAAEPTAAIADD